MSKLSQAWNGFLRISLWLASIGLMIASSGIDGAYLAKLMPEGWAILGLILNTVADLASEIIMYWYGRLKQAGRKRLTLVLVVQIVLVGYAWLFGWRELLPKVREFEQDAASWLAPIMAAFIPVALIGIGYVQSLLAGKVVSVKLPTSAIKADKPVTKPVTVPAKLSTEQLKIAVLDAMLSDNPPTQVALAAKLGTKRSTVSYHVRELRKAGKLNGHKVTA